jgi:hypothetical protein
MSRQENTSHRQHLVRSARDEARHLLESTTIAPVDDAGYRRRLADILTRAVKHVYPKPPDRPKKRNR